jgi:hypothetical protein
MTYRWFLELEIDGTIHETLITFKHEPNSNGKKSGEYIENVDPALIVPGA